jgi:ABC-2 type transport system permease protein
MKAEFFKLLKSVGFRTCIIVFACRDILYLLLVAFIGDEIGLEMNGYMQFEYLLTSFSGSTVSGMLFGFIAASLITTDYKSRDIQCAIAQGYSRAGIMWSKIIIYIGAIWALALMDVLIYTLGSSLIGGFGVKMTGDVALYMVRSLGLEALVLTAMYMTCVLIAFAFTSKAASVSINILLFFVIDLGVQIIPLIVKWDKISDIIDYLPFVSVSEMSNPNIDWGHAGISITVAVLYGAAMILATWQLFRKRDLK